MQAQAQAQAQAWAPEPEACATVIGLMSTSAPQKREAPPQVPLTAWQGPHTACLSGWLCTRVVS